MLYIKDELGLNHITNFEQRLKKNTNFEILGFSEKVDISDDLYFSEINKQLNFVYQHFTIQKRIDDTKIIEWFKNTLSATNYYLLKKENKYLLLVFLKNPVNKKGFTDLIDNNIKPLLTKLKKDSQSKIILNKKGHSFKNPLSLYDYNVLSASNGSVIENQEKPKINFNDKTILNALSVLASNSEFIKKFKAQKERSEILLRLANDKLKNIFSKKQENTILVLLKKIDSNINLDAELNYHIQELQNDPSLRSKTGSFTKYLNFYAKQKDKSNIATLLISSLEEDFEPNSKYSLEQVLNLIISVFDVGLIDRPGNDKDNVVIFNPLSGTWVHNEDIFASLIYAVRPEYRVNDVVTMMSMLGSHARNQNLYFKSYDKSRHLLFKNGCLDIKTMKFHDLAEDFVKDLHLVEKNRIQINYQEDFKNIPPRLKDMKESGGDWDIANFLLGYAGEDNEKFMFLSGLLVLGFFPNHNFGAHINFRGESGFGKSTISEIYKGLFGNQNFITKPLKDLNDQFGLTNTSHETYMFWFTEGNSVNSPLNELGISQYDALADRTALIQRKHNDDIVIENPPQVVIDGTGFIKASEMTTGPARRTLPFSFPMVGYDGYTEQDLRRFKDRLTSSSIYDCLHDEETLQWLINWSIRCYKSKYFLNLPESQKDRLYNLSLNLSERNGDLRYLPDFIKKWHREMTQTQGNLSDWFVDEFEPYFSTDQDEPQFMNDDLAYGFYSNSYETKYSRQDPRGINKLTPEVFYRQFENLLREYHWNKVWNLDNEEKPRKQQMKNLDMTNFRLSEFEQSYKLPTEFSTEGLSNDSINSYPLGQRIRGWYMLKKVTI